MAIHGDGEFVDVMICLMPINNPDGQEDYVAVSLPWKKCTEAVCGEEAKSRGMTFSGDGNTSASLEDFITCWEELNENRMAENQKIEAALNKGKGPEIPAKRIKMQASKKKGAAAPDPSSAPKAVPATSEGSSKKRQSKAKPKSKTALLTLDDALARANKLSTKTKDDEVEAIYKALDAGLSRLFPYKKHRLPGVIHSDRLHIAPDTLKYRRIAKERLSQVSAPFIIRMLVWPFPGIGCQPICLQALVGGMNLTMPAIVIRSSKYTRDMDPSGRSRRFMLFP